jgi:hypothetical protein
MKTRQLMFILLFVPIVSASAGVLTTTFTGGLGQEGNMFDVLTASHALTVTGFDLNLDAVIVNVEVYQKSGTWVGFDQTPAAWTLIATISSVSSAGVGVPTHIDVTPFVLPASAVTALYLTATSPGLVYSEGTLVGNVAASNADLSILEGAAKSYPFLSTFEPRVWNGSIYYTDASSVPEPSSLVFFLLGGATLLWRRHRSA